jgi:AraC-like DNA-binding protein
VTAVVGESGEAGISVARFRAGDLDEARALCRRHYYPIRLDAVGPVDRLLISFQAAQIGALTVGAVSYNQDLRISSDDLVTGYHVNLPVVGRTTSTHRGITVTGDPGRAVVYRPVGESSMDPLPSGCRLISIKIERIALERELEEALGRAVPEPLAMAPTMDVTQGPGRSWAQLAALLAADVMAPGGLTGTPLVAERLAESLITGLLVAVDHPFREELLRPDRSYHPRPLRLAVDAMRADPARQFSVRDLARLSGVSVRALQAIFHRHTGLTPIAYLREVRLACAHDVLRRCRPGQTTVAQVANRWGFGHLGRFAAAYRERYGTAPSQTLRMR